MAAYLWSKTKTAMKKTFLLIALVATAQAASAQLTNPSFENWQPGPDGNNRLTGWRHEVMGGFENLALHGTYPDSVSQHGQLALKLSRWYSYTYDQVRQRAPISFSPGALTGFYLYTNANLVSQKDTAVAEVYLTRWNAATQQPDTVGFGEQPLPEITQYTAFSCAITYTSSLAPDSITVLIKPTKTNDQCEPGIGGWCSFLTVDNLSLSVLSAAPDSRANTALQLVPNPANRHVRLTLPPEAQNQTATLHLTDLSGKTVRQQPLSPTEALFLELRLPSLPAGLYVVKLQAGTQAWQQKLVLR